ncbi:hypothetical protein N9V29_03165 [Flavobacteriales bacterium]|nr:hypothetical protein [Flavobacteriales bacterium]
MTPKQLQTWLENGPKPEDLEALRSVVAQYPYSGPLRMMLAKASELALDLDRRNDLLRAGAHVPSRRALFAYMMGPSLLAEARAIHDEIETSEEVSEEALVQMVWHSKEQESEDQVEAPADATETSESQESPGEEQREAMVAAIASVIERDVQTWTEQDDPQEPPTPEPESAPDAPASHGVAMVPVNGRAQPQSLFGQWLQQRAAETGFGQPELAERGAAALIDAFLAKGDVRIGPVRESRESTEEWAKQSLVEDASLVTETMAKLYAQQGQMGRARKAYKLLALKYPEKSVYFAAQLKKLRKP